MPKSERLAKFRNDSVDEVDTTDLEQWKLRETMYTGGEDPFFSDEESDEPFESGYQPEPRHRTGLTDEVLEEVGHEMAVRHRLDLAKLFLNKDNGYTLRKFKRIYKREMEERPEQWDDGKPIPLDYSVQYCENN